MALFDSSVARQLGRLDYQQERRGYRTLLWASGTFGCVLAAFFEEYFAEIVVIVVIFDTDISNTSSGYFLNSFEKRVRERELER